jgi:hypothetical protein
MTNVSQSQQPTRGSNVRDESRCGGCVLSSSEVCASFMALPKSKLQRLIGGPGHLVPTAHLPAYR